MVTTPNGNPVASHRVAEAIAERILSGRLAPGTRIKQEELAAELGASRVPVREALRILESRGLVGLRANSGAWVAEMTPGDLNLSYQIRERVEPLLLLDSMPRLTEADVAELHEIQDAIEATDDVEEFLVLDRKLHWTSYRAHQTALLATMVERLWDTTQHYRREFMRLSGGPRSWVTNSEHRLLIEAIERRDGSAAEDVLALHIRRTRVELGKHPGLFEKT
ncbi:MAG TPA: GntR family transcriptional regulator [Nocardioidaceae bacterium]